jgi:hypothetical protein
LLKSALVMCGGRTCKVIDLKCILSLFVTKKRMHAARSHKLKWISHEASHSRGGGGLGL